VLIYAGQATLARPLLMLIHRSINVFNTALARRYSKISIITKMSAQPARWFDSLPTPVSNPAQLSATELHGLFQSNETRAKVLVVDVRRADIEVGIPFICCSQDLTRQGRSSMYDPKRHQPPRSDIPPDPTKPHLYVEPVRCNKVVLTKLMIDIATSYFIAQAPTDADQGVQLGMRMHYSRRA
jgi:hypothetical protein